MLSLNSVLFPVDFSRRCEITAGAVKALVDRTGASLTLFHVFRPPLEWVEPPGIPDFPAVGYDFAPSIDKVKSAREHQLKEFCVPLWNPNTTSWIVDVGDPAAQLLAHIDSTKPSLVMLPTHGHGTFRRLLVGSVTNKLLHDAGCAVWTDSHIEALEASDHKGCQEVLCGVDLIDLGHDNHLVEWAAGYARIWGARLRLFHAVPGAKHIPGTPDEPFTSTILDWARERLSKFQIDAGTLCEALVQPATPGEMIRALVKDPDKSTVIIGRGSSKGFLGRLGSQAYSIIRSSPCPVISV